MISVGIEGVHGDLRHHLSGLFCLRIVGGCLRIIRGAGSVQAMLEGWLREGGSLWIIRGAGSVHCMLEGYLREGGSLRIIRGGGSVQAMIQGQSTPCYG